MRPCLSHSIKATELGGSEFTLDVDMYAFMLESGSLWQSCHSTQVIKLSLTHSLKITQKLKKMSRKKTNTVKNKLSLFF